VAKNKKTRFFYVLYSDKTWVFDQVAKDKKTRFFYVLYSDKTWVFDQTERAQGPVYIITVN